MAQYKGAACEGSRAMQMLKKRELAQEEMEFKKKKIEEQLTVSGIKEKFATHYDAVEQQLKVWLNFCSYFRIILIIFRHVEFYNWSCHAWWDESQTGGYCTRTRKTVG